MKILLYGYEKCDIRRFLKKEPGRKKLKGLELKKIRMNPFKSLVRSIGARRRKKPFRNGKKIFNEENVSATASVAPLLNVDWGRAAEFE